MQKKIALLPGDGIGPEIMKEAGKVLKRLGELKSHNFQFCEGLVGGAAYDRFANHLPAETLSLCESCDAILLGAVGGPISESNQEKWKNVERKALLGLRRHFNFFANLRPIRVNSALTELSQVKLPPSVVPDILIVRELTGGIYFGKHETIGDTARDEMIYIEKEISRIAFLAFNLAKKRFKHITLVDKANVLDTSRLWRNVTAKIASQFPKIQLDFMYVDNAAMQIIKNPAQFDVILTENMFGDILSDLASVLSGSLGLLPSASLNESGFGLYEPISGSAPDIAGKGIANPIGQILSAALMLKYSFGLNEEAKMIENAVQKTLVAGIRTADIFQHGMRKVDCETMGNEICRNL